MRMILSCLVVAVALSTGCGGEAPQLPPDESMAVSFSSLSGGGSPSAGLAANVLMPRDESMFSGSDRGKSINKLTRNATRRAFTSRNVSRVRDSALICHFRLKPQCNRFRKE